MEAIRVLIVDDHAIVRDGLTCLLALETDIAVVGEPSNGVLAVEMALELQPDVILMDLRMPEMSGLEAMRRIRADNPDLKFIVLTIYDSDEYVFEALEAGAKGFLLKDAHREELFRAIRAVFHGESLMCPSVNTKVLHRLAQLSDRAGGTDVPSEREIQVLRLIAGGATNQEIAISLSISVGTVRTHVTNILKKLDAKGRTQAVTKAMQRGIIITP